MKLLKQKGFTLVELIITCGALATLIGACVMIYVAIHYISKFW